MAAGIVAVLLVPLIAMAFTREVRWTPLDFLAAVVLLGSAAVGIEVAVRLLGGVRRALAIGGVLAAMALLWAQGAVGIV